MAAVVAVVILVIDLVDVEGERAYSLHGYRQNVSAT